MAGRYSQIQSSKTRATGRFSRFYGLLADYFGISPARLTGYLFFAVFIFAVTLTVRSASSRDPGSWFFDPDVGYSRQYSAVRQQQAERLIEAAKDVPPYAKSQQATGLCIGIPSIARDGARYLRTTVGSLLAGLSKEERAGIYLMVFLPHSDPTIHPAAQESWLANVADEILLYNVSQKEFEYIKTLEEEDEEHRTKGLYDYNYLLKACYAKETPYIALIEDDVIAMDGWYHRTIDAIQQAEVRSAGAKDFLYLRLFYTEEFLGWNSENWPTYAFWSVLVFTACAGLILWLPTAHSYPKRILTVRLSLFIVAIMVPWMIVLVFAAGKVTVLPMPEGINEMNNFGCCAQGLVFPRHKAANLIDWFESSKVGFADMLIEDYANAHGEQRWAITPSVLQHIGIKSSKPDDFEHGAKYSKPVAATIWNFAFEQFVPKALRKEHELAAIDATNLGEG